MATESIYEHKEQRIVSEIKYLLQNPNFEVYGRIGKKIAGETDKDNCCKITLPCRYADKQIRLIIHEID
jgi:hypothetical protein